MAGDGRRELGMISLTQPFSAGRTMAKWLERIVVGQHLVNVVEQRGRLDRRGVERDATAGHGRGKERRDFRHGC